MKRKRRLFGILLIIASLVIMQLPVSEADAATSASDFRMEGTTLVKYLGTDTSVSVPNTVEVIAVSAFEENDKIEVIELPSSVTAIEPYAFWGCDNLRTVVLGSGMKEVGDYTFANCKGLETMSIPGTIKTIGIQAFVDCVNLTDITLPPEVTSIHDTSFDGCSKLYIHCKAGSFADAYAMEFYKKQEEMPEYEDVPEYQQPDNTEDENTGQNIPEVSDPVVEGTLLGSTQVVGNSAVVFIDNRVPDVIIGSGGEEEPEKEPLVNDVQEEQGMLSKYTIVDGKIVADQAYYRNQSLGKVLISKGIKEIGQFAFSRSSLTGIEIPNSVDTISYGAFYHCDKLKEVVLSDGIENVEPKAFAYTLWVEDFLANGTEEFLISGNVLVAYRGAEKNVVIPDGVTVIAGEAFMDNSQLQTVVFPESMNTIGEGAFEGCTELTKVTFGKEVYKIKDRAFAACSLEEVTLPGSIREIGLKAFDEDVAVFYEEGANPTITHETSAERLSNEKYRDVSDEEQESIVTVTGVEAGLASLEGAKRSYTLSVTPAEDDRPMENAYMRYYKTALPRSMIVYNMNLTDDSGIPLTKLGKQFLTVTLPIPETLVAENLIVYAMDRNGQLEKLKAERVLLDGEEAIRFQMDQLSQIGICGDGSTYSAPEVLEVVTTLQSMSRAPGNVEVQKSVTNILVYVKWISVILLMFLGTVNVLYREKRSVRR